jgi:hypothetical protein
MFFLRNYDARCATVSGFSEMLSISWSIKNCAKAAQSLGAWPQNPILRLLDRQTAITSAIIFATPGINRARSFGLIEKPAGDCGELRGTGIHF